MMNIATLNNISELGLNLFTEKYQLIDQPEKSHLILVRSHNMHDFDIPKQLLAVARAGAGVNNIPLDLMADKGVVVFNTPGANSNGVKELVIAGMLMASRDIVGGIQWVNEHKQDPDLIKSIEKAKKAFAGKEIMGKTIAILGLGAIGAKVANACVDLGMKVYGYDPYISEENRKALKPSIALSHDLDKLYVASDFISLHIPLLPSTKDMFDETVFAKVKKGMVLLNFSRDGLVKEEAMKQALEEGIVAKYVTDFPNHFMANLSNVIAIPHLGASTEESEDNCAIMAAQQLMNYVERGDIQNAVNYPNVVLGAKAAKTRVLVLAKVLPDTTEQIDAVIKTQGHKVTTSVVKTRNQYGVFAYDLNVDFDQNFMTKLEAVPGVIRIRII